MAFSVATIFLIENQYILELSIKKFDAQCVVRLAVLAAWALLAGGRPSADRRSLSAARGMASEAIRLPRPYTRSQRIVIGWPRTAASTVSLTSPSMSVIT